MFGFDGFPQVMMEMGRESFSWTHWHCLKWRQNRRNQSHLFHAWHDLKWSANTRTISIRQSVGSSRRWPNKHKLLHFSGGVERWTSGQSSLFIFFTATMWKFAWRSSRRRNINQICFSLCQNRRTCWAQHEREQKQATTCIANIIFLTNATRNAVINYPQKDSDLDSFVFRFRFFTAQNLAHES